MNRAPCCLSLFFIFLFPDQADNQRDQEKGNADDAGGEPDLGTEDAELFNGQVVTVLLHQGVRIPVYGKTDREDDNQQRPDEDRNGAGVSSSHNTLRLRGDELLVDPALFAVEFNPGPAAFNCQDRDLVTLLQTTDAIDVGGPVALLLMEVQVVNIHRRRIRGEGLRRGSRNGGILSRDIPGVSRLGKLQISVVDVAFLSIILDIIPLL